MNIKETSMILEAIRIAYPNTWKPEDYDKVNMLWASMLEDVPYEDIYMALKCYTRDNKTGFAPTIGQLMGYVTDAKASKFPSAEEAWALVRKAISNGIYGAREEFDKLPDICKKLVADPSQLYDWAMLDNEGLNVAKSIFLKRYPEQIKQEKFLMSLPPKVAEHRERLAEGYDKVKRLAEKIGGTE